MTDAEKIGYICETMAEIRDSMDELNIIGLYIGQPLQDGTTPASIHVFGRLPEMTKRKSHDDKYDRVFFEAMGIEVFALVEKGQK